MASARDADGNTPFILAAFKTIDDPLASRASVAGDTPLSETLRLLLPHTPRADWGDPTTPPPAGELPPLPSHEWLAQKRAKDAAGSRDRVARAWAVPTHYEPVRRTLLFTLLFQFATNHG